MTEFTMDRLRENLESLKMKNTLEILDNYLERAVAENLNIVDVLDHIFAEEAKSKRKRAYEKQIQDIIFAFFPWSKELQGVIFLQCLGPGCINIGFVGIQFPLLQDEMVIQNLLGSRKIVLSESPEKIV